MKRCLDVILVLLALPLALIPITVITICLVFTSGSQVLYWSNRVGRNNTIFKMPKFRTMKDETPQVATHLLQNAQSFYTPIGSFLRKTSLDELPQLYCILTGDMTWVGPRPALFNQEDLIKLRTSHGVHVLVPGLTGWAQINGRDELPVSRKVDFDKEYLQRYSISFDLKILALTLIRVIHRDGIAH